MLQQEIHGGVTATSRKACSKACTGKAMWQQEILSGVAATSSKARSGEEIRAGVGKNRLQADSAETLTTAGGRTAENKLHGGDVSISWEEQPSIVTS